MNTVEFGGSAAKDDTSGSGFFELAIVGQIPPEVANLLAKGVTDPWSAEVLLALHSHGPATSGSTLAAAQISSYFGGCIPPLLGNAAGFAEDFDDIPSQVGECSTISHSMHLP